MSFDLGIGLGVARARGALFWSPERLFAGGEDGTATGNPFEAFTDTGGTTAADFGDAIARINDRSPNARNALQSSSALRPLLGRAPVDVRNRLPNSRGDGAVVGVVGSGGALPTGWALSGLGTAVAEVISLAPKNGRPNIRLRISGAAASTLNVFLVGATTVLGDQSQTWTTSVWLELADGDFTNIGRVEAQFSGWTDAGAFVSGSTVAGADQIGVIDLGENRAVATGAPTGATVARVRGQVQLASITGSIDITLDISAPQLEQASEPSPVQITGAGGLDITEAGFPSPAFIRPDLSDDVLPTAFPDGFTGDVMVFGRKGSWIERNVEIASAGSLNIGPETFTGAPAGVLAALGDIVGWVAVERTLTDFEVARLVQYHRARGAKGLLVPGPELIVSPPTTSDGWTDEGGGVYSFDSATSGFLNFTADLFDQGKPHIANVDFDFSTGTVNRIDFGGLESLYTSPSIPTNAPFRFSAIPITTTGSFNGLRMRASANAVGQVSNLSVRELRPEEDW